MLLLEPNPRLKQTCDCEPRPRCQPFVPPAASNTQRLLYHLTPAASLPPSTRFFFRSFFVGAPNGVVDPPTDRPTTAARSTHSCTSLHRKNNERGKKRKRGERERNFIHAPLSARPPRDDSEACRPSPPTPPPLPSPSFVPPLLPSLRARDSPGRRRRRVVPARVSLSLLCNCEGESAAAAEGGRRRRRRRAGPAAGALVRRG